MKLDVFIEGELIDLCIPTEEFAAGSNWYSWFNNPKTNKYLEQGAFPNTVEEQVEFFRKEKQNRSRLMLIVSDKKDYLGTISLSFINHEKKTASVAMLIGENTSQTHFRHLFALESMARMVEHGFEKLGLMRIDAGQHHELFNWQQRLELIGFRVEAYKRYAFIKGIERTTHVGIAVNAEDYLTIKQKRGAYWDSAANMDSRLKKLPKDAFIKSVKKLFDEEGDKYYEGVFSL